jgi:3-oxoacyl-[acyl-carrier protein] reductase
VTVNVLNPGGGANTPGIATEMREASARGEVPKLVEPDAMERPICWLLSNASNGVTGMRFDAKTWNSELPADDAARSNAHPAGLQLLVGA